MIIPDFIIVGKGDGTMYEFNSKRNKFVTINHKF